MIYTLFVKKAASPNKSSGSGSSNEPNYQLEDELHKQIIQKSKKRKAYSLFRDNI